MPQFSETSPLVRIATSSRYKDTPLLQRDDGVKEWGLWVSDPSFRSRDDTISYQVVDSDIGRLDLISWKFYNTPAYWWMIADANNIVDPFRDMRVGDFIQIPSRTIVDRFVSRRSVA